MHFNEKTCESLLYVYVASWLHSSEREKETHIKRGIIEGKIIAFDRLFDGKIVRFLNWPSLQLLAFSLVFVYWKVEN